MKTENCYNPMNRRGFNWALKLLRLILVVFKNGSVGFKKKLWQVRSEGGAQQRGRRRGRGAMTVRVIISFHH